LPAAFERHPLVRRAMEELKMLTQTDLERERYEARRKAQLDYQTGSNSELFTSKSATPARLSTWIDGRAEACRGEA
jgi:hypothetical protein